MSCAMGGGKWGKGGGKGGKGGKGGGKKKKSKSRKSLNFRSVPTTDDTSSTPLSTRPGPPPPPRARARTFGRWIASRNSSRHRRNPP